MGKNLGYGKGYYFSIKETNFRIENAKAVLNAMMNNDTEEAEGLSILPVDFGYNPIYSVPFTPIISYAIKKGFYNVAKNIINQLSNSTREQRQEKEKGYFLNLGDRSSSRAIYYAVEAGQVDLVEMILENGANPSAKNSTKAPLHSACEYYDDAKVQKKMIKLLLEAGANIVARKAITKTVPFHLLCKCGLDEELIKLFIDGGQDLNVRDANGKTPLFYAIVNANDPKKLKNDNVKIHEMSNIIKLLVKYNANVNLQDDKGNTPLHQAIISMVPPVVINFLLEKGADYNIRNNDGLTAFELSEMKSKISWRHSSTQKARNYRENYDIFSKFLNKKDNKKDSEPKFVMPTIVGGQKRKIEDRNDIQQDLKRARNEDTNRLENAKLILQAMMIENDDEVERLSKLPIDFTYNSKHKSPFKSAIIYAILKGYYNVAKNILNQLDDSNEDQRYGKTKAYYLNLRDRNLMTPILFAVKAGQVDLIEMILKLGANPNIPNKVHKTSLHVACEYTENKNIRKKMIKLLLEAGANIKERNQSTKLVPFHLCAKSGFDEEIIKLFLDKGQDLNVRDANGKTPIYYVLEDLNIDPRRNKTPIEMAELIDTIKLLVKNNANINLKDVNGNTPLHQAIISSVPATVVRCLLESGADTTIRNKDGLTAFELLNEKIKNSRKREIWLKDLYVQYYESFSKPIIVNKDKSKEENGELHQDEDTIDDLAMAQYDNVVDNEMDDAIHEVYDAKLYQEDVGIGYMDEELFCKDDLELMDIADYAEAKWIPSDLAIVEKDESKWIPSDLAMVEKDESKWIPSDLAITEKDVEKLCQDDVPEFYPEDVDIENIDIVLDNTSIGLDVELDSFDSFFRDGCKCDKLSLEENSEKDDFDFDQFGEEMYKYNMELESYKQNHSPLETGKRSRELYFKSDAKNELNYKKHNVNHINVNKRKINDQMHEIFMDLKNSNEMMPCPSDAYSSNRLG